MLLVQSRHRSSWYYGSYTALSYSSAPRLPNDAKWRVPLRTGVAKFGIFGYVWSLALDFEALANSLHPSLVPCWRTAGENMVIFSQFPSFFAPPGRGTSPEGTWPAMRKWCPNWSLIDENRGKMDELWMNRRWTRMNSQGWSWTWWTCTKSWRLSGGSMFGPQPCPVGRGLETSIQQKWWTTSNTSQATKRQPDSTTSMLLVCTTCLHLVPQNIDLSSRWMQYMNIDRHIHIHACSYMFCLGTYIGLFTHMESTESTYMISIDLHYETWGKARQPGLDS